ncbi:4-carboxymuconolactone decarboxylase [Nocardia xishanensis]|uniref:4-carboxymuconolactone decarboxylase n=1 Tax=Nocardia xishanensis TaxID=238964 RepID=A0ABW7WRT2_9NOCA
MTSDPDIDAAMAVRRAVLGDTHVDRAQAKATEFTRPFQEYLTAAAWGGVWTRDGLDRRTRSAITLAVLTALGCHDELAMHVRAALRNGLTEAEIGEVLLHTAPYSGIPKANSAFAIADQVLRESAAE